MRKFFLMYLLILSSAAFGQLQENFNDGNFSNNPYWVGDSSKYQVNAIGQLQSSLAIKSDTCYLSTKSTNALNTIWEFEIKMHFDPSTTNQSRFYLCASNSNLKGSLNGYFIQIGESGISDSYDLYKQKGMLVFKIIDGPPIPRNNTDTVNTKFKISRSVEGEWIIFSKTDLDSSFQIQGIQTDKEFTKSNFLGVYSKYTASRSNKFFYDNINTYPIYIDTIAPEITHIDVESANTITIQFDEPLDTSAIFNLGSFILDNTINPIQIKILSEQVLQFIFAKNFSIGLHKFIAKEITDLLGNRQDTSGAKSEFQYIYHHIAKSKDVIISEIFADPTPSFNLPPYEYIEIYNRSEFPIPLNNWTYSDNSTTFTFKNDSIFSKEFIILCKQSDTSEYRVYGKTLGLSQWPSLNNSSDNLILKNNLFQTIDSISYNIKFYKDLIKRNGGYSLEIINPESTCKDIYNWDSNIDSIGGSPGKINSQIINVGSKIFEIKNTQIISDSSIRIFFSEMPDSNLIKNVSNYAFLNELYQPNNIQFANESFTAIDLFFKSHFIQNTHYNGELFNISNCKGEQLNNPKVNFYIVNEDDSSLIVINELLPDPLPSINLPAAEFIELYNPNDTTVNLTGWRLKDPQSSYTFHNTTIEPNEYLIICAREDTTYFQNYGKTLGIFPMISLNNSLDTLQLLNKIGRLINEVKYNDNWYRNTIKKTGGYSLEKINPKSFCDDATNWSASNSIDGGTPGHINSIENKTLDTMALLIQSVTIIGNNSLQIKLNKGFRLELFNFIQIYLLDTSDNLIFPLNFVVDSPYNTIITLNFPINLKKNTYQLFCNNLITCNGAEYYFTESISPNPNVSLPMLKFTEIMVDPYPSSGLPAMEYIEILNAGTEIIYTNNMGIKDKNNFYPFPNDSLLAGTYAIICYKADSESFAGYGNFLGLHSFPSLNNTADSIFLMMDENIYLDSIFYKLSDWDLNKRDGGYSLERFENAWDCDENLWRTSKNELGGTPGKENSIKHKEDLAEPKVVKFKYISQKNIEVEFENLKLKNISELLSKVIIEPSILKIENISIAENKTTANLYFSNEIPLGEKILFKINKLENCLGVELDTFLVLFMPEKIEYNDLIINELLFNPNPGIADFVELYNKSEKTINLFKWQIGSKNTSGNIININKIEVQHFIKPKEIVCISIDTNSIQSKYNYDRNNKFIEINSMPAFNDDIGHCILLAPDSTLVDELMYSEKMHLEILENLEGVSLEKRNANVSSNEIMNWTSAASSFGFATPSLENSQHHEENNNKKGIYLDKKSFTPNADGKNDFIAINYSFPQINLQMNIKVYNRSGHLMDEPLPNSTIGQKGIIYWDGIADNAILEQGIYILLVQVYNSSGFSETYKLPCALISQ